MEAYLLEWASLLGRWLHLVTGIAWIGASFYFVWLDNHLLPPGDPTVAARGVGGEVWAVHGGGFYNAHKYRLAPATVPSPLHWFYWEAYATWLSGFFLLCLLYYRAPERYLVDPAVADLGGGAAVGLGLGTLVLGWLVYDGLCRALGHRERVLGVAIAVLLAASAGGLCQLFSGRGAYIQFGAMLGTIMGANVFFVIIPGQRAMVAAAGRGEPPDPRHGQRGKQRSVHNTYFTLPVLFAMLSNHYAITYGATHNGLVLIALCGAGAAIRAWFVARHRAHERGGSTPIAPVIAGVAVIAATVWALHPAPLPTPAGPPAFATVAAIVERRCAGCHADHPTQPGFAAAPKGYRFDSAERIRLHAAEIATQIGTGAMPLGNLTGMTLEERATVRAWAEAGAPP